MGTNTAIVCHHLGLEDDTNALKLIRLARADPNIHESPRRVPEELAFWRDLIESSVAQIFKYQDEDAYLKTIGKLPRWPCSQRTGSHRDEVRQADGRPVRVDGAAVKYSSWRSRAKRAGR